MADDEFPDIPEGRGIPTVDLTTYEFAAPVQAQIEDTIDAAIVPLSDVFVAGGDIATSAVAPVAPGRNSAPEWPRVVRVQNSPILAFANQSAESVYWPCLVDRWEQDDTTPDAERFALLYSTDHAGHSDSGIYLAYGPSPLGPFVAQGRVYRDDTSGQQTETPSVYWQEDAGLWYCYHQQGGPVTGATAGQVTILITSPDLETWSRVGVVIDVPAAALPGKTTHSGYFRRYPLGGEYVGWNIGGGSKFGPLLWRSVDGETWRAAPTRYGWYAQGLERLDGYTNAEWRVKLPYANLLSWRGRWQAIMPAGPTSAGGSVVINRIVTLPMASDLTRYAGPIVDITPLFPAGQWDEDGVDDFGIGVWWGNRYFIPYRAGGRQGNIGIMEVV